MVVLVRLEKAAAVVLVVPMVEILIIVTMVVHMLVKMEETMAAVVVVLSKVVEVTKVALGAMVLSVLFGLEMKDHFHQQELLTNKSENPIHKNMKAIAITSLALNVLIIGTGVVGYLNKDKIVNTILNKVKGQIPELVKESMPSMPTTTGLPKL
jgi:hypothetical protein